jgi:hypothetical protein
MFRVWVERQRALDEAATEKKKRAVSGVPDLDAKLWAEYPVKPR